MCNTHALIAHTSPSKAPFGSPSKTNTNTSPTSHRLLLASVLECDAQFSSDSDSGAGTLGIISVERRNADGVDDFLALARERMEVAEVQRDERRGWFIYELRRRRKQA